LIWIVPLAMPAEFVEAEIDWDPIVNVTLLLATGSPF
jgi:hypothetical protein